MGNIGVEVDDVILCTERIMQGMEFLETAEFDVDLGAMGIRTSLPMLDGKSPLIYAIAHWDLVVHRGAETYARVSLKNTEKLERTV